jgi:Uma2 family endonuclease
MSVESKALASVEEYLHTSYRPDCDYVDGEIVERNVGEKGHGKCQGHIYAWFLGRSAKLKIYLFIEQRLQVGPTRFQVPDVCVVLGREPAEQIFHAPPFIVIEILSPTDRIRTMQKRVDDYLKFGVPYVWVIDPQERRAFLHTREGSVESKDLILRTENPEIILPLAEIFSAL